MDFHTCSLFGLPNNDMVDKLCPIFKLSSQSSILTLVFLVNGAPRTLVDKSRINQSITRAEGDTLKGTDGRVGA